MKTVLITAGAPVPQQLRELIERGSTSYDERRASDVEAAPPLDVDRIVFWVGGADPDVSRLVERYVRTESAERREMIVFVSARPIAAKAAPGLPPSEAYVWPRDEDRLKMAFLTGA
jgi:hypothetical protein